MAARVNPSAGPKPDKIWREAIQRAVRRRADGKGSPQELERLATALVDAGLEGDISALREIGDRLDGKPAQAVVGEADSPLKLIIGWAGDK